MKKKTPRRNVQPQKPLKLFQPPPLPPPIQAGEMVVHPDWAGVAGVGVILNVQPESVIVMAGDGVRREWLVGQVSKVAPAFHDQVVDSIVEKSPPTSPPVQADRSIIRFVTPPRNCIDPVDLLARVGIISGLASDFIAHDGLIRVQDRIVHADDDQIGGRLLEGLRDVEEALTNLLRHAVMIAATAEEIRMAGVEGTTCSQQFIPCKSPLAAKLRPGLMVLIAKENHVVTKVRDDGMAELMNDDGQLTVVPVVCIQVPPAGGRIDQLCPTQNTEDRLELTTAAEASIKSRS